MICLKYTWCKILQIKIFLMNNHNACNVHSCIFFLLSKLHPKLVQSSFVLHNGQVCFLKLDPDLPLISVNLRNLLTGAQSCTYLKIITNSDLYETSVVSSASVETKTDTSYCDLILSMSTSYITAFHKSTLIMSIIK